MAEIRVLALELGYVAHGGVEALLPTVYGGEQKPSPIPGHRWDEQSFFAAVAQIDPESSSPIRLIFEHAVRSGASFNWGGGTSPSVGARFNLLGTATSAAVWTCYAGPTAVSLCLNFGWMTDERLRAPRQRLAESLRSLPEFAPLLDGLELAGWKKYPSLPILAKPDLVDKFLRALDEFTNAVATAA